jgi:hypothetical protein
MMNLSGLAFSCPKPGEGPPMLPQFIRILDEEKEILIPLHAISKIEVRYAVKGPKPGGPGFLTSLKAGMENPDAIRVYKICVGGDEYLLPANPESRVMKILEEIYKNTIKDG